MPLSPATATIAASYYLSSLHFCVGPIPCDFFVCLFFVWLGVFRRKKQKKMENYFYCLPAFYFFLCCRRAVCFFWIEIIMRARHNSIYIFPLLFCYWMAFRRWWWHLCPAVERFSPGIHTSARAHMHMHTQDVIAFQTFHMHSDFTEIIMMVIKELWLIFRSI